MVVARWRLLEFCTLPEFSGLVILWIRSFQVTVESQHQTAEDEVFKQRIALSGTYNMFDVDIYANVTNNVDFIKIVRAKTILFLNTADIGPFTFPTSRVT